MDPKRWCKDTDEHRLYHAIGEECPCHEEMIKARKAKMAALRAQITGVIQNTPVQRSKLSYVPDPRRQTIG